MDHHDPAPEIGRQPKIVEVGGKSYRVTPPAPRKAARLGFQVLRILGEPLAALMSSDGLPVEGLKDDKGRTVNLRFEHLLHSARAREALVGKLVTSMGDATPEEFGQIVDDLLVGQVEFRQGPAWLPFLDGDTIDHVVPDLWGLLGLLRHVLGAILDPTSAGAATSGSADE